jgi:hypothetical protein
MDESISHELVLPQGKESLLNAVIIIKEGINKANKSKQIDLRTAVALRDTLRCINEIVSSVVKSCYKDDKLINTPLSKIITPDKQRLESMLTIIFHTIDKAQINGAYDTVDESGNLFDSLSIVGNLLGSMITVIDKNSQAS